MASSSESAGNSTVYDYDLLPRIFKHFDKHLQIFILDQLIADHDTCVFNPYTKQSLLMRLKSLLEKTCRWAEYEECLTALGQYDPSFIENLDELMEPMMEKTRNAWSEVTSLTNNIIQLYFDDDDENDKLGKRSQQINRVHSFFEDDNGDQKAVVTFSISQDPQEVFVDQYREQIETYQKAQEKRRDLHKLYRFAHLLFELHVNPENPENRQSLLPQVKLSLTNYITLVKRMMDTLKNDYENCGPDEKIDHEYLTFNKENEEFQEQARWGVICCKLLEREISEDSVDDLKKYWQDKEVKKPLAIAAKERAWLLHWVLFQNFLNEKESRQGMSQIWDMFNDSTYKYTIITVCPWLLRYLVLSLVCSPLTLHQKLDECNSLAHGLLAEGVSTHKDPLTEFLRCLFVDCDFDKAAAHLKECRKVFATDIFLCSSCNLFFSQARLLLFSRYSSVNLKMDIDKIGELLMLGRHGEFEDDNKWSVGGQPVHREERALKQWITDTVRSLQKERQTADRDKSEPTFNIRIDLRANMLLAEPTYEDPRKQLLQNTRETFFAAKQWAQNLR